MLNSENIEYVDIKENLEAAIDLITEINRVMKIVFKDFTDKKVIMKGEIMHRKLESYQEKIRTMVKLGEETFSKKNLMDRLASLTENVLFYLQEYAESLLEADKTFRRRLNRNTNGRTDMN
jgi:hypothetical protein